MPGHDQCVGFPPPLASASLISLKTDTLIPASPRYDIVPIEKQSLPTSSPRESGTSAPRPGSTCTPARAAFLGRGRRDRQGPRQAELVSPVLGTNGNRRGPLVWFLHHLQNAMFYYHTPVMHESRLTEGAWEPVSSGVENSGRRLSTGWMVEVDAMQCRRRAVFAWYSLVTPKDLFQWKICTSDSCEDSPPKDSLTTTKRPQLATRMPPTC